MRGVRAARGEEARVAETLTVLSTAEIVAAVGVGTRSPMVRAAVARLARGASARLGRRLARFDARIGEAGIAAAAREVLAVFGAEVRVAHAHAHAHAHEDEHEHRLRGAALVVANHPGAYDALALMAAIGRDDVAFLAADRPFLRAMPALHEHLVLVDEARAFGRLAGLRRALAWLEQGHVLVQLGAGAIEPDARFLRDGESVLGTWSDGTGVLAARAAALGVLVVPAFVSGVHSARAKRLPFVRWAERRGITTIAPLVQATVPGFRDVVVAVRFGAPVKLLDATTHAECTLRARAAVAALAR